MATAAHQRSTASLKRNLVGRWFFVAMALIMMATSMAGFLPAIMHPATRRAPLSALAAAHGMVFFAWQILYLVQSLLVATGRTSWHRKLGQISVVFLLLMIPLGFTTTTAMVRRGFDLSGDQHIDPHPDGRVSLDAPTGSVFNFASLLTFVILAIAAIGYRRHPLVHKRLMLFANVALMAAPITHLMSHIQHFGPSPATFLITYALFLLAVVAGDYLTEQRIRTLTVTMAIGMFVVMPLQAVVIGPSETWHRFAAWLSR